LKDILNSKMAFTLYGAVGHVSDVTCCIARNTKEEHFVVKSNILWILTNKFGQTQLPTGLYYVLIVSWKITYNAHKKLI